MQGKLMGCPSVAGLYAWPPVDGEYAKFFPSNRAIWDDGRPVRVYPRQMQIKVEQDSLRVTVRSRVIDAKSPKSGVARDWAFVEYSTKQFSCKSGMLVFEELPAGNAQNYGGTDAKRGFTLTRMTDGSLAVGIKTTAMGRSGSLYSWGGQSYGSYGAPDKVFWSWSKLGPLDPAAN